MEKDMVCIVCPNGCKIHSELDGNGNLSITGNRCVRGIKFAKDEMTGPTRSLTTTVATDFNHMPWLPVRTDGDIPRELMFKALDELSKLIITERVKCGQIIYENLLDTGVNVIATMDI